MTFNRSKYQQEDLGEASLFECSTVNKLATCIMAVHRILVGLEVRMCSYVKILCEVTVAKSLRSNWINESQIVEMLAELRGQCFFSSLSGSGLELLLQLHDMHQDVLHYTYR